jgi:hypothetical protein
VLLLEVHISKHGKTRRLSCHPNNFSIRLHLHFVGFEKSGTATGARQVTVTNCQRPGLDDATGPDLLCYTPSVALDFPGKPSGHGRWVWSASALIKTSGALGVSGLVGDT